MSSTKSTVGFAHGAMLALMGAVVLVFSAPAHSQDATWDVTPGTNDFNTGANWTPNSVPTGAGVAFFSFSNTTTLDFSASTSLAGISLGVVAPAYVLNINSGNIVTLNGQGLANAGGLTINVEDNQSRIVFRNNATADTATINAQGDGSVQFQDQSTAGSASFNIMVAGGFAGSASFTGNSTAGTANIANNGQLGFLGASNASNATITNDVFGDLFFNQTGSAGNAVITNLAGGKTIFRHNSTAANATIVNLAGGETEFDNDSTAGTATFGNSGLFDFNDASDAQTAAITNMNGGTLWFNQTSTANGATIENQAFGEIRFRNNSTAGSSAITNNTNAELAFYHDATAGNATITNQGVALLEFKNNSTAGTSVILNNAAGEVEFEDDSSAGNASITNNGGTLTFFDSSTAANATITTNGITGFVATSSGGMSRQIVEAGGFVFISPLTTGGTTFGSIEGAGDIGLGAKKLAVGSLNTDTEFSGVITGNGAESLEKVGTGVLTLSGNSTYTGNTRIFGGTLIVNGILTSNVQASGGSTLGGTGSVGLVEIKAASFHAPGNSIGTQTVNGNYGNSGTLQIEVDENGDSDKVIVNGMVNIASASLQVIELAGSWDKKTANAYEYVIIENDGNDAVNGSFASITNSLAFLTATVSTAGGDGNDVVLTLARNGVQFVEVAQTPNQKAVATSLANGPLLTNDPDVNDALLGLSASSARNAFDLMSGEVHASSAHTMMAHSRTLTGMAGERLWGVGDGSGGGTGGSQGVAMMGLTGSATELYNNRTNLGGRMNVGGDVGGFDGGSVGSGASPSLYQRFAMWVRGYGERSSLDDDGNGAELDARSGGVMAGGDVALTPNLRAGIMGNWGTTSGSIDERLSSFDINTGSVAAYAGYASGPYLFKGLAGYSHHGIDTSRAMSFGNLNRTAVGDYDGNQAILYGEAAYRMGTPDFGLMPLLAMRWSRVNFDGFSEAGAGSLNLTAHSHSETRLESILGLRLASTFESGGVTWLPQARIGWTHAYGDLTPDIDFSFEGGGDFTIAGTTGVRNALTLGAGLNVTNNTGLSGFVDYSGNLSNEGHDHTFSGGLRSAF